MPRSRSSSRQPRSRSASRGRSPGRPQGKKKSGKGSAVRRRNNKVGFTQVIGPSIAPSIRATNKIKSYRGTGSSTNISGTASVLSNVYTPNKEIFQTLASSVVLYCRKNGFTGTPNGSLVQYWIATQTVFKALMSGSNNMPSKVPVSLAFFLKAIMPKTIVRGSSKSTYAWSIPDDFISVFANDEQCWFGQRIPLVQPLAPFEDAIDTTSGTLMEESTAFLYFNEMMTGISTDVELVDVREITYDLANAFTCGESNRLFTANWSRALYAVHPITDWISFLGLAQVPTGRVLPEFVKTVQAPPQVFFGFMLDQNWVNYKRYSKYSIKYRVVNTRDVSNVFIGLVYEAYINNRYDWASNATGLEHVIGGFMYILSMLLGQYAHRNVNVRYQGSNAATYSAVTGCVGTSLPIVAQSNITVQIPAAVLAAVNGNAGVDDGKCLYISGMVFENIFVSYLMNALSWIPVIDQEVVNNLLRYDPTGCWWGDGVDGFPVAISGSEWDALKSGSNNVWNQWNSSTPVTNALNTQPIQTASYTSLIYMGNFAEVEKRQTAYIQWWKNRASTDQVRKRIRDENGCVREYLFFLPAKGAIWGTLEEFLLAQSEETLPRVWYTIPDRYTNVRIYQALSSATGRCAAILSQVTFNMNSLTLNSNVTPSIMITPQSAGISSNPTPSEATNVESIFKNYLKAPFSVNANDRTVLTGPSSISNGQQAVKKATNNEGGPWWKTLVDWCATATKGIPIIGTLAQVGQETAAWAAKRDREIKARRNNRK